MRKPSEWTQDEIGVGSLLAVLYGSLNFLMTHGLMELGGWPILPALLVSAFWSVASTLIFHKGFDLGLSDWNWAYPVGFLCVLTGIWGPIVTMLYSKELGAMWGIID